MLPEFLIAEAQARNIGRYLQQMDSSRTPWGRGEPLIGPDNCIFLGYRFYYRGQRELAGKLYEICAEMHPGMAPLWWHIGRAREEGGDREGAIRAYSRARDANPWYGQPADAIRRLEEIAQ